MALLFDYCSEPESDNAVFNGEILKLTKEILKFSHLPLTEDIHQTLTLIIPELNPQPYTIDNMLLLNTLGAVKVHQIITALIQLGDNTLLKQQSPQSIFLQNLKTLIDHWSDFGEWIVQHSQQENP